MKFLQLKFSFFSNAVLKISNGIDEVGEMRWELCAYLAIAWVTVYFVVWKGLHNSSKVIKSLHFFKIKNQKSANFKHFSLLTSTPQRPSS